ncbi:hypothetical protein ACIO3O_39250 [Streptomyces sp. NPDC087440]|uniref:hypothetical protein n=1 Tax=Streptomyces sp. NPDC087440 TaxID=3365790 RepID=UPI003825E7C7
MELSVDVNTHPHGRSVYAGNLADARSQHLPAAAPALAADLAEAAWQDCGSRYRAGTICRRTADVGRRTSDVERLKVLET